MTDDEKTALMLRLDQVLELLLGMEDRIAETIEGNRQHLTRLQDGLHLQTMRVELYLIRKELQKP